MNRRDLGRTQLWLDRGNVFSPPSIPDRMYWLPSRAGQYWQIVMGRMLFDTEVDW